MKKSIVWLILASVVSLTFIVTACGQSSTSSSSAPATTTAAKPASTTTTAFAQQTQTASTTKPKYGGVFNTFTAADTAAWDPGQAFDLLGWQISVSNEALMSGDWAKGPAGTNEADWTTSLNGNPKLAQGLLATSYEVPDNQHVIFHIRQGVHWWNKAPANGREFTADDAAWNINQQWSIPQGNFQNFFTKDQWLISAKALDKYTLQITVPLNAQGTHW